MSLRWRPPSSLRGVVPVATNGVSWLALYDDRTDIRVARPGASVVAVFDDRERPLAARRASGFGPVPEHTRSLGVVVDDGTDRSAIDVLSLAPLVEAAELPGDEIGDRPFPGGRGPMGGCVACGTPTDGALCDYCQGVLDAAERDRAASPAGPEWVIPLARTVTGLARPLHLIGIEAWPASFTLVASWAGRFVRLPPLRLDLADDRANRYTGVVREVTAVGTDTELVWSAVPALAPDAAWLRVVVRGAGGPLVDLVVPFSP